MKEKIIKFWRNGTSIKVNLSSLVFFIFIVGLCIVLFVPYNQVVKDSDSKAMEAQGLEQYLRTIFECDGYYYIPKNDNIRFYTTPDLSEEIPKKDLKFISNDGELISIYDSSDDVFKEYYIYACLMYNGKICYTEVKPSEWLQQSDVIEDLSFINDIYSVSGEKIKTFLEYEFRVRDGYIAPYNKRIKFYTSGSCETEIEYAPIFKSQHRTELSIDDAEVYAFLTNDFNICYTNIEPTNRTKYAGDTYENAEKFYKSILYDN